jgi:hypothetical protein
VQHRPASPDGFGAFDKASSALVEGFTRFGVTADKLIEGLGNVPESIQLQSAPVTVIAQVTGTEAFQALRGSLEELIANKVDSAITRFAKAKLPDIA